jgi:membrane protease YdiL (CAAX protease family)
MMKQFEDFFREMFEFSKPHVPFTKFLNIMAVFTINILWLAFVFAFLVCVGGLNKNQVLQMITVTITTNVVEQITTLKISAFSPPLMFFLVCILAPLWEEFCFRVTPIKFSQFLESLAIKLGVPKNGIVAIFAISFAIFFGILHGNAFNICIQGVSGLLFCWLYLRNNNSYLSVVLAHAIWNFMIVFCLPFIMGV